MDTPDKFVPFLNLVLSFEPYNLLLICHDSWVLRILKIVS